MEKRKKKKYENSNDIHNPYRPIWAAEIFPSHPALYIKVAARVLEPYLFRSHFSLPVVIVAALSLFSLASCSNKF
jgi:hypothetical protein